MKLCNVRGIARTLDMPVSMVHKILQNTLHCYYYKFSHVQESFPSDLPARETFFLEVITLMEMDSERSWKILWSDKAHFRLTGYINSQNRQIWERENPVETQPVPVHPPKAILWCVHYSTKGHVFFEETGALGPVIITVTG